MASKPATSKAASRYKDGPQAIGALLPGVTRAAFRAVGASLGQLIADWPAIVGPAMAEVTSPRRLSAGSLTLGCAGPVAIELQHMAEQLMQRINGHLGGSPVKRLRFVQQSPATPPLQHFPKLPKHPPIEVEGMPEGPLRDALGVLGAAIRSDRA